MKVNVRQTLALRLIELTTNPHKVDYKEGLVYYSPSEYAHWTESHPQLETMEPLTIINEILRIQGEQAAFKLRQDRKAAALKEYITAMAEEQGITDASAIVVNPGSIDSVIQRAIYEIPYRPPTMDDFATLAAASPSYVEAAYPTSALRR